MRARARPEHVLLLVAVLLLGGCSQAVNGTVATAGPHCARHATPQLVNCVAGSLSAYWTDRLHRGITMHAVLDPEPEAVPRDCRSALRVHTAFTCPDDRTVYLTAPFVRRLRSTGPPRAAWVRIAATMAHEMGHVIQFTLHLPLVRKKHPTASTSRAVEQQADCLGGAWAAAVGIDDPTYLAANRVVFGIVNSRWERRSHGAPAQRLAAVRRGQTRGPRGCGVPLPR
jgi:predicted metalloprotease